MVSYPQQRLYFLPLPHGHGWLRPTLVERIGAGRAESNGFLRSLAELARSE